MSYTACVEVFRIRYAPVIFKYLGAYTYLS